VNQLADPSLHEDAACEVDVEALRTSPEIRVDPPMVRRRTVIVGVAVAVLVAGVAGGGVWWHGQVTGDPGLEFYGGPNVYRDEATTDTSGIERKTNLLGDEVGVAFVAGGRLFAHFGLYNGGAHDVRIEAAPAGHYFYWGFDRMSLSTDPDDGFVGVRRHYEPFRPFTLHPGETREVRLEYRQAVCDPAELQPGSSSVDSLRLRYRILGISRTASIPFRESVIAVQTIGDCAHPIAAP
jgi:hypothetical protein